MKIVPTPWNDRIYNRETLINTTRIISKKTNLSMLVINKIINK